MLFLLGLAIVPAAVGLGRALLFAVGEVRGTARILSLEAGVFAFLAGFCGFSLMFVLLPRPTRVYVFAHEMTHALFARMQGARVRHVEVGSDRGSVQLSRTHLLTLLAPYFFPLYSVLLTLVLAALAHWLPVAGLRIPGLALLGVSWGFHFCFTIGSLSQHQTDLDRCGYVFGYAWIAFLNLVLLACGLLAANAFAPEPFRVLWYESTLQSYAAVWETLLRHARRLTDLVR